MFIMRFDMRAPEGGPAPRELYATALEMARWGEDKGCVQVVVSEHHGSEDGYLPSPLVLASALAGATKSVGIQVAALILPLHDPIRVAEDIATLDIVSGGRVSYVMAVGYVPSEYAMMGRPFNARGRRMDACLEALQQAWTGDPFDFEGRPVRVTPKPLTPGGPTLFMGGNSQAAVRRAARFGMSVIAQGGDSSIEESYHKACEELGKQPGMCFVPPPGSAASVFVARDVDRAWREIGPHMLHDAQMYARWMGETNVSATKSVAQTVDALRAEQGSYRIFTPDEAVAHARATGPLLLQPLCGGTPPDLAWQSLELIVSDVLPALRE